MLNKLHDIIAHKNLLTKDDKVLVAVSGGVDSMVLSDLMAKSGYDIAIAHVNYKMRGKDSDMDEASVKRFCNTNDLDFHVTIMPEAIKNKKNFQNQARIFRYKWFEELCQKYGYTKIATAHHLDDEIESFFLHLFRASGIGGLAGINDNLNSKIIRPLLTFSKDEIYQYASTHHIGYREDKSNQEIKYLRNKIRNILIPTLHDINPDAVKNISKSIQYLKETDHFLSTLAYDSQLITVKEDTTYINLEMLNKYSNASFILYYFAKAFGFKRDQTDAVWHSSENGAKCLTHHHQLIKDRSTITIKPVGCNVEFEMFIKEEGTYNVNNQTLVFNLIDKNQILFNKHTEYLGFDKLPFPLTVRSRKPGDTFSPLGMKGLKKSLKKFIIDEKMDALQKDNMIVIEHNGEICYVAPYRISESFKVMGDNAYILKIEIK